MENSPRVPEVTFWLVDQPDPVHACVQTDRPPEPGLTSPVTTALAPTRALVCGRIISSGRAVLMAVRLCR